MRVYNDVGNQWRPSLSRCLFGIRCGPEYGLLEVDSRGFDRWCLTPRSCQLFSSFTCNAGLTHCLLVAWFGRATEFNTRIADMGQMIILLFPRINFMTQLLYCSMLNTIIPKSIINTSFVNLFTYLKITPLNLWWTVTG